MRARSLGRFGLVCVVICAMLRPQIAIGQTTTIGRAERDPPLDRQTALVLDRVTAAAVAESLPSDPLRSKALEGVSKGASVERIAAALDRCLKAMHDARQSLGHERNEAELMAAASALDAGASTGTVAAIRVSRAARDATVPLVVLTDLIARGISADSATLAVSTLVARS